MPASGARRAAGAQRASGRHATRSQAPSTEEEVFDVHSVHDSSDEAPPAGAKPRSVPPPSEPIDLAASEEEDALGEMDDVELAPSAGPSAAVGAIAGGGGDADQDDLELDDVELDGANGADSGDPYAAIYNAAQSGEQLEEPAQGAAPVAPRPIHIQMQSEAPRTKRPSGPTPRDRRNRVLVHKLHVLCVLAAARVRNRWCNDAGLRTELQQMVPNHLLNKLAAIHPRREPERRERVRMFEGFMHDLVHWWCSRFRLVDDTCAAAAWRQPSQALLLGERVPPDTRIDGWVTESAAARDERHRAQKRRKSRAAPMEVAVFPPGAASTATIPTYLRLLPSPEAACSPQELAARARERLGSRETSAILFCSLCRSLGVPARLVVSVQAAPPSVGAAKAAKQPPQPAARRQARRLPQRSADVLTSDEEGVATSDEEDDSPAGFQPRLRASRALERLEREREAGSYYVEPVDLRAPPTVWVEVFSKPYQHWLTVDPVRGFFRATGSRHMEPLPANRQNKLVYVVAFEEDGYARDVTARYTRTLHTRVARQRPSNTARGKAGEAAPDWWTSVAQVLHRPQRLDRDAAEDVELQASTDREPMPSSVGAFKDHPVYVLERHLRRDEVVHPPQRIGTFQGMPVYPRAHVVRLQNARQWYNEGREVKSNEIALKWVKARGYTLTSKRLEEQARAEGAETPTEGLYAHFQTQVYVPPPVKDGQVPRNTFGNIDLFVPSMLPAGGAHIPYSGAAKVAKRLGVSYADAITGFDFKKFRSTPRIQGIVVPAESESAVLDAYWETEQAAAEKQRVKRQEQALAGWRRLILALSIAKRVQTQYGKDAAEAGAGGGGFLFDDAGHDTVQEIRQLGEAPAEPEVHQLGQAEPVAGEAPAEEETVPHAWEPAGEPAEEPTEESTAKPAHRPIRSIAELMAEHEQTLNGQRDDEHAEDAAPPKRRRIVLRRSTRRPSRYAESSDSDEA